MSDTLIHRARVAESTADPLVVISSDCHVSPSLETELRPYCPEAHLAAYDDWLASTAAERAARQSGFTFGGDKSDPLVEQIHTWNLQTEGHHDIHARLRDLDRDGVVGEIIFHGSAPFQPIPFMMSYIGAGMADPELAAVGQRMYNAWLADFCSVEPERHVGLAHLPMWDVDAAVAPVEWARAAGLRGVNFPRPARRSRPTRIPYGSRSGRPARTSTCRSRTTVAAAPRLHGRRVRWRP
jgi:hypothetical protein